MKRLVLFFALLINYAGHAQEAPVAIGGDPTTTQIEWSWHSVADADGYKWNTTDSYATATDNGEDTTVTETSLIPNTQYTRYFWAYNECSHSSSVSITESTLDDFVCGTSVTKSHVAGSVAPIDKTVTYGTVTDVPGETELCWITRNLGATTQATSKSDATESSAGWYWQFNKKQGYKYDGSTRTPNTTWIVSISDNSDWEDTKDPCTIELGTNWRIPTRTEWDNIVTAGGWSTWIAPWASTLKIHAAGRLSSSTGVIGSRGVVGYYWSSTQVPTEMGWRVYVASSAVNIMAASKIYGYSIRCVKEPGSEPPDPTLPDAPTQGTHTPSINQIIWKWNTASGATGYKWNTTNDYGTATNMSTAITKSETGLSCNTSYTRYVWAYNGEGNSTSTELTSSTLPDLPDIPGSIDATPSKEQIVWRWSSVDGVTGYKWNTTYDYNTAVEIGSDTVKTETGLTCNTEYTRYVWAYSSCGNSDAVDLTETTLACAGWTQCGDSLLVYHTAGVVSPVTKTVTYGTTNGIPGSSGCWITQNLGATSQATAINDVTEASAGWYWQFNRKQGYKHTGTARTPSSAWGQINESSNWTSANDPCTIELGSGWRIPTKSEWISVDASGGWINKNQPWSSDLKIHPAGRLYYTTGALGYRGVYGYYWSGTGVSNSYGYAISISSTVSTVNQYVKSMGYSVRCVK